MIIETLIHWHYGIKIKKRPPSLEDASDLNNQTTPA